MAEIVGSDVSPKKVAFLEDQIRPVPQLIAQFKVTGRTELHDSFCVPLPSLTFLRLVGDLSRTSISSLSLRTAYPPRGRHYGGDGRQPEGL